MFPNTNLSKTYSRKYFFKTSKIRSLFLVGLMLFLSTSTYPYFSQLLVNANITVNEINEEENETNHKNQNKIGSFCIDDLQKFLSMYETNIKSIIYYNKKHSDHFPEVHTPPPEFTLAA